MVSFRFSRPVARGSACVLIASAFFAGPGFELAHAQSKAASASGTPGASKPAETKPLWRELTPRQQRALQPLAAHWNHLTIPHKRKWLALSRNYAHMSAEDQEILHSRMSEWSTLSPQERDRARFNFAELRKIPADERKAKWEAYQALSAEEKHKLASRAAARPPGASSTIAPIPSQKLAPVSPLSPETRHAPRIQLAPPAEQAVPAHAAPAPVGRAATPPPVSAEAQVPPPTPEPPNAPASSAKTP
ncbi:MAG: DUF3106 domain-containing protein [Gammaproteobacteria bacterium]|nr:DUF3106 domain-containing protein [Gammaproteobacteria bacterium]MBU1530568.1 DUF3106 domain-containing protein [Gammaproteobacteria bacterium]MBU2285303.1 DUF3106 domain-containing protein [Gammaproteobacteria bacterium]MBU2409318.1 DUF3106 domain-containing protein [Gammaproteobacteria bacterium]